MSHPNKIFSPSLLLEEVWDYPDTAGSADLVRVHIKNLREAIEPNPQDPEFIKTIKGGCLFCKELKHCYYSAMRSDMLPCYIATTTSDKGKAGENQRRKAMGLPPQLWQRLPGRRRSQTRFVLVWPGLSKPGFFVGWLTS